MRTGSALLWLLGALAGPVIVPAADASAQPGNFCGRPQEKVEPLFERLSKSEKLPEIHRDKAYVALFDKARDTTWTFTVAGHPAHPSAVCRQLVKDGDRLRIEMSIACGAPDAECEKLATAFEELNQRMLQDLEKQQQQK